MGLKTKYTIKPLDYATAQSLVVKHHYLHRKAPMSFAFGLLDIGTDEIVGVVIYGVPSSSSLRSGLAGIEHVRNIYELTRLWIAPDVPRNAASYLIGNTLKLLDREYIISYADTGVGHVGYVYQATNWLYTGLSAKRTNWTVEGYDGHSQSLADKYSAEEIREKFGDKFSLTPRSRKHRYLYINARGKRKQELLDLVRYPIVEYPKGETHKAELTVKG
jgi:hypothetical protein